MVNPEDCQVHPAGSLIFVDWPSSGLRRNGSTSRRADRSIRRCRKAGVLLDAQADEILNLRQQLADAGSAQP
jgi:hypothetical protein